MPRYRVFRRSNLPIFCTWSGSVVRLHSRRMFRMRVFRLVEGLTRRCQTASRTLASFGRDKRGNVAVILAIAAIPTLGSVGAGIDYSIAYRARTKLQAVAD